MADLNSTSTDFRAMAVQLNQFGSLLAGIESICRVEDVDGDALNVAATVSRQINQKLCLMADQLDGLALAADKAEAAENKRVSAA